jgi:hypothetical protein
LPAALFVGWLAGQLQWRPVRRDAQADGVHATFAAGSRTVEVRLLAQDTDKVAPGRLMTVDVAAGLQDVSATLRLERVLGERMEIRQTLCITGACTVLKTLPIIERDEATVLGAAIESQSAARVFPRAAKLALWLLGEVERSESEDMPTKPTPPASSSSTPCLCA